MKRDRVLGIGRNYEGQWRWVCYSCHHTDPKAYSTETEARKAFRRHRAWKCPLTGDKK